MNQIDNKLNKMNGLHQNLNKHLGVIMAFYQRLENVYNFKKYQTLDGVLIKLMERRKVVTVRWRINVR